MRKLKWFGLLVTIIMAVGLFGAVPVAVSDVPIGPIFNPANGHYYELISDQVAWLVARDAAESRTFVGMPGHLATITSAEEQTFVALSFPGVDVWLGGFQPLGSPEPDGNWQWVTGEPFSYTHWWGGGPNNYGGTEDCLEMNTEPFWGGYWNDLAGSNNRAYIIEYDVEYYIIQAIENFFRNGIIDESLWAVSSKQNAKGQLKAFGNMLERAEALIAQGYYAEGIQQLQDAYYKVDGQPNPPDFVTGIAREALAQMILDSIHFLQTLL